MSKQVLGCYPKVEIEGHPGYPEVTKVTISGNGLTTVVVEPELVRYDQFDRGTPRLKVLVNGHAVDLRTE